MHQNLVESIFSLQHPSGTKYRSKVSKNLSHKELVFVPCSIFITASVTYLDDPRSRARSPKKFLHESEFVVYQILDAAANLRRVTERLV